MTVVVTYRHAWLPGLDLALCPRHSDDHRLGTLAGVSEGAHEGRCGLCDVDAGLIKISDLDTRLDSLYLPDRPEEV